jgi:D-alanyl-D-alanine carboxypeptidase
MDDLPSFVESVLALHGSAGAEWGVHVRTTTGSKQLVQHNTQRTFAPASNTNVFSWQAWLVVETPPPPPPPYTRPL